MITSTEKKRWIDALLSGEFKQGKGLLFNGRTDKYCCLGVECLVNKKATREQMNRVPLPIDLCMDSNRRVNRLVADDLADLNDEGVPFELIAGLVIAPWDGVNYYDTEVKWPGA